MTMTLTSLRATSEVDAAITGGTQLPFITRAWYNKVFLTVVQPALVHDQFGLQTMLPANTGEQVMWRRWPRLATNVVPLTEGVTPTGTQLTYVNVIGTTKWYGDWIPITDTVKWHHVDDVLSIAAERLGMQAAETKDEITRDVINAGTGFLRIATDGANPTHTEDGERNTVNGVVTKAALDSSITILEAADAKYYHGQMNATQKVDTHPLAPAYIAITHPHVVHGLVKSQAGFSTGDWIPRQNYAAGTIAYPTEVGTYRNVRVLTSTAAKVWADTGGADNLATTSTVDDYRSTTGSLGDVYSFLILAKESFGTVKMKGAAETYYDPPGGNSDPLHQRSTAGWKACLTATILNDEFMHRLECLALW